MDKREWRAAARAWRRDLTLDHLGHRRHLERFLADEVDRGRFVVVYDAMPDEIDLDPLLDAHPDPPARFAVTRTPDDGFELTVHPVGGPVERHPFGYRQPALDAPVVADDEIGAVLVPGLAFACDGARLGRGKGYYDRFLARLGTGADDGPYLIGITADQVVADLPTEDHDVSMTHLSTGTGVWPVPVSMDVLGQR